MDKGVIMEFSLFVDYFKTEYIKNHQRQLAIDDELFETKSFESFSKKLKERSVLIRDIYLKNLELIDELKTHIDLTLDEEKASLFYSILYEMYDKECDDYYVMSLIIDKLFPYYEKTNNYGKLIMLNHMKAFEYYESYGRTGKEDLVKESCSLYKKAVSYKEHYNEIQEQSERLQIFIAYSNLIAPFGQMKCGTLDEVLDIYKEVLDFYESDVCKEDHDKEDFVGYINQIKEDILFLDESINLLNDKQKEIFFQIVDEASTDADLEGNLFRAKSKVDIYRGKLKPIDAINNSIEYIKSLPLPDYKNEDDTLLLILNYHNNGIDIYEFLEKYINKEEWNIYTKQFLDKVMKVHLMIPYSFYTQMMNNVCQEFYRDIHSLILDKEEKKNILLKMILVRQPTTYMHSLMVSKIAKMITSYLVNDRPELFVGPLELNTLEDVLNNKDKILSYIESAGLFHDVGKCFIVDIINQQARRLSDIEFGLIKEHPEMGLMMIDKDEDFKEYFDIILGHHKYFNDLGGYPKSFKKNESIYHNYIDIITISDCIDAATDILGRNYQKGKNFDSLFKELEQDKGFKYNDIIVDYIGQNKKLYDELKEFTLSGRENVYYEAYINILNEKN